MGVGNGLSTPVGSNWLHVVAMTLNTKQQQQQQQQQQNKTKRQCSYGSPGVGTMPHVLLHIHSSHIKVKCSALKNIRLPKTSFKTYRFAA